MRQGKGPRSFVSKHFAPLAPGLLLVAVVALVGTCLPSRLATARQDATAVAGPPTEIDSQRLAARIAELSTQEQNSERPPESAQELTLLQKTRQFLELGAAAMATADRFADEARSAPEQSAQIDTYLATPTDQLVIQLDRSLPLEQLKAQLEAARVRLQTERDLRAKVDTDQEYRTTRRTEVPAERADATEQLDALKAELATGSAPDEPEAIATAKRWRALAERYFHLATLRALDEELRNYDARRSLLDKRRAYRDRRVSVETRSFALLQESIGAKQVESAEAAEREAARQRRDAASSHPLVRTILEDSQAYTARNTAILGLNSTAAAAKTRAEALLEEWKTPFGRSKARVERVGLTNAIGQHLRNQRSRLPGTNEIKQQMAERDSQVGDLVNEAEDLSLVLDALADVDDVVQQRMAEYAETLPGAEAEREEVRLAARDALAQQREYLTTLSASINNYLDTTLFELQNAQRDLRDLLNDYADFIDERILWIRSAQVMNPADLLASADAIVWLVDGDAWATAASSIWRDAGANVGIYAACVLLLLALLFIQPRLRRELRSIADKTKRSKSDAFSLTVTALLITVLIAAVAPAMMAFVAWRLSVAVSDDSLGAGLSIGLFQAAELLLAAELIRVLCRSGGVGESHFRWKQPRLRTVRRHLRWLVPIVVPLSFVVGATSPNDNHHDSLGRIAFIATMIAFAVFLQRMLRPTAEIVRSFLARRRGGWIDRLKYVWYPLIVAGPLATAVVAGLGYFYSAVQLEQRVLATTWLFLLVLVGRAMLLRSLFLAQRRLDMEQRRKKRAAEGETGKPPATTPMATPRASAGPTPAAVPAQSAPVAEGIDVAAVSAQTRQLLNAMVGLAVVIGLAVVWIDMLPALGFFHEIELWTSNVATSSPMTAGATDGEASAPALAGDAISLGHVLYSVVILLITALVSKNIPGLLEIVLLQRLPISPSGRYAITTLARYALVIVGVVLAFGAIGIGWSKVQWLAAAVTVGLGFGLQEIFANFVSGLIILFERPIRVGDTVTVGGISGTVSRLRIRATTIVDWDRKELIIPNKEFVTGQIVNWTLSDPILRVVIEVGIAYGSDTKLAEKLLLKVAKDDPLVLDEPPSSVLFGHFGDSALNFKLRVFIPHIDNFVEVRHRLHNAVDQAFREAGIVIAFPQHDVHFYPAASPAEADGAG